MIAKITLGNFFSFGETTTIELNPELNILVGINGSGKSNLLKAIRLLYEGVIGGGFEKIFLQEWGGFDTVKNANANINKPKLNSEEFIKIAFEFDKDAIANVLNGKGYKFTTNPSYNITIHPVGGTSYYLGETFSLTEEPQNEDNIAFMMFHNGEGFISVVNNKGIQRNEIGIIKEYYDRNQEDTASFKSTELALRQISDPNRFAPLFTLKTAIEKFAVYDYFDTTLRSPIRQAAPYDISKHLLPNGQNLASLLNRIKNHHSLAYEKLEHYIQKINPYFKDINFDILGSKLLLVLRERHLSKAISVEHISDGTLRYLLLLAIVLNPERGNLICIDEPEIGLHPDMIHSITEAAKAAARNGTQLLIATHSPLLLNAFEVEDVLVFEKNEENQTLVSIKTARDFSHWNDDFLVGQAWLNGLIGGKRW